MNTPVSYPLTVFYDGSCPMCASEMHALRDLDTQGRLTLVDCSVPGFRDDGLRNEGVTHEALTGLIHARDARGRWMIGIDCFEAVYRAAGLEGAARVWGSSTLRPVLTRIYPWIARHRQLLSRLGINALVRHLMPKPCRAIECKAGSCRNTKSGPA